jgi:TolB-like protein/DNA-binding winged helix-turn-helix (wHTH) protein/tetratricopeptide (TPR) repeat protein
MATNQINLAETPDFDLGGVRVSPAHRLIGTDGEQKELEPKVAQVLVALASVRPQVVSRDRLIEQCWDGRIVGDDALNRCIVALRHLAREFAPEPFTIETVSRVGYSLVEQPNGTKKSVARRFAPAITAAVLVAALIAILLVGTPRFGGADAAPASIAVLPFRNLSTGNSYFADGISEEIVGRLVREPQLRVAGSASSGQFGDNPDIADVARRLNVNYVLEGSVRTQGDRVRVNASLIRARDRARLWSDTYDGTLADIFAIQTAIGQGVAGGLRRKLLLSSVQRSINGEAYVSYLNARGLIHSGNPADGPDAIRMLKHAIALEPGFAPAWSSLADALLLQGRNKDNEGMIEIVPQARDAASQALKLDPSDGGAHAIMGELLGSDSPDAIAERSRAGDLADRTAEGQIWTAGALEASGRWEEAGTHMRRAHDLDPSWSGAWRVLLDHAAVLGDRPAAQAAIKEGFSDDASIQSFALARLAWFTGDFSEAARRWSVLAKSQSQWSSPSKLSLDSALLMLKLSRTQPSRPPRPSVGQQRSTPARIWMTVPPDSAEWRRRNRSSAAELVYRDENVIAAKLMLNAGRSHELVATYDSPTGLLGLRRGQRVGTCFLQSAAILAIALRAEGRNDEAASILASADAAIQAAYRRGPVPLWFEDDAAGIWALQGKPDMAVDALDRALRRGSSHSTRTDLPTLGAEPAFRALRGNAPFEKVRAKYDAHFTRERLETERALKIGA